MALKVSSINLRALKNSKEHRTNRFEVVHEETPTAVFRRGQEFEFDVTFSNRPYNQQVDKLRVLFRYEDDEKELPPRGGSWIIDSTDIVEDAEMWSLRIVSQQGKTLTMKMKTPITTPIGCWNMVIKSDLRSQLASEIYTHPETIYLLLNPWHKDDSVYMPDTSLLEEYVLNDIGKVYIGPKNKIVSRPWLFGQFESHVLPIVRKMLTDSELDYFQKGNPLDLVRVMFQAHTILEGNWSGEYSDGTSPCMWTGSAPILKQFYDTEERVKYGQCWVFASLACSICRAIGIPARTVTNIVSAMDADSSLTLDKYFDKFGNFLSTPSESIWNFHVWTDVWMARPDLPPGFGGWQAIDATSELGPASLEAIKRGEVGYEYNVADMIGEVNCDLIHWVEDDDALLGYKKIKTFTDHIGYKMLTKKPHIFDPNGDRDRDDVMNQYKNPEGSREERLALYKAAYQCSGVACQKFDFDSEEEEDVEFDLADIETIQIGESFAVVLDIKNTAKEKRTVDLATTVLSYYYNGVKGQTVKKACDCVEIAPNETKQYKVQITPEDYIGKLVEFCLLKTYIMATVKETKQIWSSDDDFQITKPSLTIQIPSPLKAGKQGKILFKLKNPLKMKLKECQLAFDCPGLIKYQKLPFRNVEPDEEMKIEAIVTPSSSGKLNLVALFHCKELQDIMGSAVVEVA